MEHVVFFPAHDGTPAFRRVASLPDAVRLVEHLRNVENVSEVSVHSLEEVPLAFKPYYKVEVPGAESQAPEADQETAPVAVPVVAPEAAGPVAVPEQSDAPAEEPEQQGAGAASLGFFAR